MPDEKRSQQTAAFEFIESPGTTMIDVTAIGDGPMARFDQSPDAHIERALHIQPQPEKRGWAREHAMALAVAIIATVVGGGALYFLGWS